MGQTTRIFLAGLAGGVAMMVLSTVLHLSPLGWIGWGNVPNEAPVRAAMTGSIGQAGGLYSFPAIDRQAKDMGAAMKAYDAETKLGPSGLLVYRPAGKDLDMVGSLMKEFGKTLVVAIVAAFLLAETSPLLGYGARAGFVAAIGGIAALATNYSYRAWYGFPADYTATQIGMDFLTWIAGALVIATLVKPRARPPIA